MDRQMSASWGENEEPKYIVKTRYQWVSNYIRVKEVDT